ncbi:MAG: ParA family protein [Cyanobacteria bacterium P01_D01_bin.156]
MILASETKQGTLRDMSSHKIAVCGRKGGVGKTTTAACLASYYASHDIRVLVVDLDPQSNTGYVLGVDPVAPGSAELICGDSPTPLKAAENLFVLPGGASLQENAVQQSDSVELEYAIKKFSGYGVIIFDCPPGNDHLERLGLIAADTALICTNAHPLGIVGAERVLSEVKRRQDTQRKGPKHCALILTQINKSRSLDKNIPGQLAKKHPDTALFSISQRSDFHWATAAGIPFMDNSPSAKAISDIEEIAIWVANKADKRKK